jgi:tetratricopeptide (TPR) repeat protein
MPQLPFDIPKSLSSYADHFDREPIKAITRLKKQLDKRGPDAVGHFLLAWLYHLKDMDDEAVDAALKARIYAPGSPFFQKLHYYISHPKAFDAWTPDQSTISQTQSSTSVDEHGPVLDLDSLIQKLSEVESERIRPSEETDDSQPGSEEHLSSDDVDNIVSETLANIHEQQGKMDAAIQTYKRLKKMNTDKIDHYENQISRLQKLKEEKDTEES